MLNTAEIKKLGKASEKRVGKDFIDAFDKKVREYLDKAIKLDLGKRKTLGAEDVETIFKV
jgi:histone H3/H4